MTFSKKKKERNLASAQIRIDNKKKGGHCVNLQDPPKQEYYRNIWM